MEKLAWLTNVFTDSTFYVERIIAFFLIGVAVFEEKSIRTQFCLGNSFNALVIEIALLGVRKEPIVFRTIKWGYNKIWIISSLSTGDMEKCQLLRRSSKSSVWALASKPGVTKMDTKIVARARFILYVLLSICYLSLESIWTLLLRSCHPLFSKLSPLAIQSGQAMPPHDDVVKSKTPQQQQQKQQPAFAYILAMPPSPSSISDKRKKISRWWRLQSWTTTTSCTQFSSHQGQYISG